MTRHSSSRPAARPASGTVMLRSHGEISDIFAVHPLRRSAWIVSTCWALILIPWLLLDGEWRSLVLVATGWIAATGIIMVTPILVWCLVEEAISAVRRRITPPVDVLDLSPRARNLLRRHGFETIASVDATPDSSMLLLSNMDQRALREIRRAISLWRYQRWQELGFPADELP